MHGSGLGKDCGAGVGRITDQFLLRHFHEVDLVEPLVSVFGEPLLLDIM